MNTVLFFAYSFPPRIASASRRSGSWAKYLPRYGWKPLVATREWTPENCGHDPDFVRGLPDQLGVFGLPDEPPRTRGVKWPSVWRFLTPHRHPHGWTGRAEAVLPQFLRDHKVDVVLATYDPYGALWLAHRCARTHGVPWVADFRDVLGQRGERACLLGRLHRARALALEKRLIRTASAIVTVSDGLAAALRERHDRDVHVIPNGFDPESLAEQSTGPLPKFNIVYTGRVFVRASPRPVLDALGKLLDQGLIQEDDVGVDIYMDGDRHAERAMSQVLSGYRYRAIATIHPPVPAATCAAVCRSGAILLQPGWPGCKGVLSGKIFEYLAARRPILCSPGDNDCIDALLAETGAGVSCVGLDSTATQLLNWYREWKATGTVEYRGRLEEVMKYSREKQVAELASLLHSVHEQGRQLGQTELAQ